MEREPRDLATLDLLDALPREAVETTAWRVIRHGRDVLQPTSPKGRWDTGDFGVLYTSLDRNGALAEIHYQLSLQPVFPSRLQSLLWRLEAKVQRAARLDHELLEKLSVLKHEYPRINYTRTQEIAEAAAFLGFDSLIVPSARWGCSNLILFMDQIEPENLSAIESEAIDWDVWRKTAKPK